MKPALRSDDCAVDHIVMSRDWAGTVSENDRDFVQSLERGLTVLLAFDDRLAHPTLAGLATATGLSRPAVRRILLTLQRLGYVRSEGSRWALTPRVLLIGQRYFASNALVEVAQPHLLALAEETQESASLATLDGGEVVYIARVPVRRIMSINVAVGTRVPVHATSMGRVLLAWQDEATVDRQLAGIELTRFTDRTITTPADLRAALAEVRATGYSIVDQELETGLISASVPVRDHRGQVVAALASSTSSGRSDTGSLRNDVVPLLVRAAGQIGAELGHRG
jgi:IclR family pca regulon transcriptional regulator